MRMNDCERRLFFVTWLLRKNQDRPGICHRILWSDESCFTNNGWFNRNIHYHWTQENFHIHRESNFQARFSVNVWLGVLGDHVIGPYFFEGHLTGEMYVQFLREDLSDLLDDIPLNVRRDMEYFQHDGAPAHRDRRSRDYLNQIYPGRWIGNNGPILWPPRSPDLTPLDFFVWGFIKDKVFQTNSDNVQHLKNKIIDACRLIRGSSLRKTYDNLLLRASICLQTNGSHVEHLL